jgi:putative transposase
MPKTGKEVGIDIGMLNFATYSDGTVIARPDFIKADEAKKKAMQRRLSKMKKGGKNYAKMKAKYAKFCQKDRNRREDFAHYLALEIVRNYDFIAVEKLDIKGMLTNKGKTYAIKKVHQMISELGWGGFLSKLEYKAQWYGKQLVKVDTFYPSSQLCSSCGYQNSDVKNLNVRSWTCPTCGTHHDRDLNAATNILKKGKEMATA